MQYIPWDFKYYAKLRGNQILEDMQPVIRKSLDATGMFVCPPSSPSPEANRNTLSDWVRLPHDIHCTDIAFRCRLPQWLTPCGSWPGSFWLLL